MLTGSGYFGAPFSGALKNVVLDLLFVEKFRLGNRTQKGRHAVHSVKTDTKRMSRRLAEKKKIKTKTSEEPK